MKDFPVFQNDKRNYWCYCAAGLKLGVVFLKCDVNKIYMRMDSGFSSQCWTVL